jgi:hypothetical protein
MSTTRSINARAAQVLHQTREYIQRHGWVRGTLKDDNGRVCFYGGLVYGMGIEDFSSDDLEPIINEDPDLVAASWYVADLVSPGTREKFQADNALDQAPVSPVIAWNDEEERTEQEILDVLAKAEKVALCGYDPDAA